MSFNKKIISLGLTGVMLAGAIICGKYGKWDTGDGSDCPGPQNIDDKYRTTYEVFVYSFCDSDGDGVGDLNGLINKLDYIKPYQNKKMVLYYSSYHYQSELKHPLEYFQRKCLLPVLT